MRHSLYKDHVDQFTQPADKNNLVELSYWTSIINVFVSVTKGVWAR